MPSIGQENLETVMIDFFGGLRRGDFEAAAGLLDPDVSWQGLRKEWICNGREEVIDTFRWGLEQRREVDALEFTRGGEQVVLGARGPSIGPAEEPLDQIFNVFTLRDGRIVRIDPKRKAPCAGLLQSPLTDSNRRPPPYHQSLGGCHGLPTVAIRRV